MDPDALHRKVDLKQLKSFLQMIAPPESSSQDIESLVSRIFDEAPILGIRPPMGEDGGHRRHITYKEFMAWHGSRTMMLWIEEYRRRVVAIRGTGAALSHSKGNGSNKARYESDFEDLDKNGDGVKYIRK